jgi:hypothetical protein
MSPQPSRKIGYLESEIQKLEDRLALAMEIANVIVEKEKFSVEVYSRNSWLHASRLRANVPEAISDFR